MSENGSRPPGVTRRTFLKGAGVSAVAIGLAACTDSNGPTSSSTSSSTTSSTPTPPPPPPPDAQGVFCVSDIVTSPETWHQPWVWRPKSDGRQLVLRVVENQNGLLFSWDGVTPGPTIRMRGDQTLAMRIDNELGLDVGKTTIHQSPDPITPSFPGPEGATIKAMFQNPPSGQTGEVVYGGTPDSPVVNKIPTMPKEDWCLGEHVNGVHSAHVTNLHTHGLHVTPGRNADGTHSDNIYLRIVPAADFRRIEANPECVEEYQENLEEKDGTILDASANFQFILGNVQESTLGPGQPHPPGTFWYHPHSHGATQNQVASGMAGFLIVEGDVDEAVNQVLADDPTADPNRRVGPYDYRERTMFIQRVFNNPSTDPDVDKTNLRPKQLGNLYSALTNGSESPNVIVMRPGAIERWRVLNGSVDGSGFIRVMVLKGLFEVAENCATKSFSFIKVEDDGTTALASENEPNGTMMIGDQPVAMGGPDGLKQRLWQLAFDGVTLLRPSPTGDWEYFVKDLNAVNGGKEPDFGTLEECYQGENPKLCYRRPNELFLADANRGDLFFQAPEPANDAPYEIYTVLALPTSLNTSRGNTFNPQPTVVAHVVVKGPVVPGGLEFPADALQRGMPVVQPYMVPVTDEELEITPAEREARSDLSGATYRSRIIRYAGWGSGAAGLPRIDIPPGQLQLSENQDLDKLAYYQPPDPNLPGLTVPGPNRTYPPVSNVVRFGGGGVLPILAIAPNIRTMNINRHKFEPSSETAPVMWRDTAEQWAVFNESIEGYSIDSSTFPSPITKEFADANALEQVWYTYDDESGTSDPAAWGRATAYPIPFNDIAKANETRGGTDADGTMQPAKLGKTPTASGGADHPFHIHQNPFWLMSLEVPNADGEWVNILEEPRWQDVTFLPRNGGRAVFRSRFPDYIGEYVNHCHILLHEDNGMMQRLRVVPQPGSSDYDPDSPKQPPSNYEGVDTLDPNQLYPKPSYEEMYQHSASFMDDNNSGQVFPLPSGWLPDAPDPAQRA